MWYFYFKIMKKKNFIIIFIVFFLNLNHVLSTEPDIFVQSTVNRASAILGDSISKEKKSATIVVTTHNCKEKDMIKALKKINNLSFVLKKTIFIRIENFK